MKNYNVKLERWYLKCLIDVNSNWFWLTISSFLSPVYSIYIIIEYQNYHLRIKM